jgi:hypothetical protein
MCQRIIIEQQIADLELALARQEELIKSQRNVLKHLKDLILMEWQQNKSSDHLAASSNLTLPPRPPPSAHLQSSVIKPVKQKHHKTPSERSVTPSDAFMPTIDFESLNEIIAKETSSSSEVVAVEPLSKKLKINEATSSTHTRRPDIDLVRICFLLSCIILVSFFLGVTLVSRHSKPFLIQSEETFFSFFAFIFFCLFCFYCGWLQSSSSSCFRKGENQRKLCGRMVIVNNFSFN